MEIYLKNHGFKIMEKVLIILDFIIDNIAYQNIKNANIAYEYLETRVPLFLPMPY